MRSLFQRLDLPPNLTQSSLVDGFHTAPTSNIFLVSIAKGHVRTTALRSSRLDCTTVRGRPSSRWRCGFDAWQRYKRFEYYLYHAAKQQPPLPDLLLLVDMDEVADHRLRDRRGTALPKFGTGRSPCGGTLPVPFPVKGFGALDVLEKLRHAGDAWRRELLPWARRERRALWRGCSRRFSADSCVPHGANWSRHPRSRLVAMAAREPALLDAGFTAHDQHVSPTLGARLSSGRPLTAPIGFAAMSRWRYLLALDGHGWQASLAAKLMLGSTVLSARSRYPLWFEPLLRHQVHVWGVAASLADLPAAVRALRADDAAARRIARQGERRIATLLREPHLVICAPAARAVRRAPRRRCRHAQRATPVPPPLPRARALLLHALVARQAARVRRALVTYTRIGVVRSHDSGTWRTESLSTPQHAGPMFPPPKVEIWDDKLGYGTHARGARADTMADTGALEDIGPDPRSVPWRVCRPI